MPYRFQGQHPLEDVELICHQHPFIIAHKAKWVPAIIWLPFLVYVFVPFSQTLLLLFLGAFVISAAVLAVEWYCWQNSLIMVTTERLVVVVQHSLVRREVEECSLIAVQQVSHGIKGLAQTLCGYGTVDIQTSGASKPFKLEYVPDPYEIQQEIVRIAQTVV